MATAELLGLPPGTPLWNDLILDQNGDDTVEELALFGELYWHISDRITATVGARWFDTEVESVLIREGFAGGPDVPGIQAEDGLNPKFALDYSFTDDQLYYVSASKGYRIGGVNSAPIEFCREALEAIGKEPDSSRTYDSDQPWNDDFGMKNTSASGRVRLSGALFFIDWSDFQQSQVLDCGYGFRLNAGASESRGAELEGSFAITGNVLWSFGVGYVDAEITEQGGLGSPTTIPGTPIPHVPDLTATTAIDWDFPITGSVGGNFRFDDSYVGESFRYTNRFPGDDYPPTVREPVNLVNLRLSARWPAWAE